jgi:hypothetical protein
MTDTPKTYLIDGMDSANCACELETVGDLPAYWQKRRMAWQAALTGGCARLPARGLNAQGGLNHAHLPLAAVHTPRRAIMRISKE